MKNEGLQPQKVKERAQNPVDEKAALKGQRSTPDFPAPVMGSVGQRERRLITDLSQPGAEPTGLLAKVSGARRALPRRHTRPGRSGAEDLNTRTHRCPQMQPHFPLPSWIFPSFHQKKPYDILRGWGYKN